MRTLLLSLLLASAAASPALADPGDRSDRQAERAERQAQRAERQATRVERQERVAPAERPQFSGQGRPNTGMTNGGQSVRPERVNLPQQGFTGAVSGQADANPNRERVRGGFDGNAETRVAPGPHMVRNGFGSANEVRNARAVQREQTIERRRMVEQAGQVQSGPRAVINDQLRQSDRPVPNVLRTHNRSPLVSEVPRRGTQPPLRVDNSRRDNVRWSTGWRNDHRYDWRSWRNHHRSHFHLGFYYDPFGWGYQSYSIGWRLWPSYYGSSYWINDPWQYRLPYAPPGTRWIRYYDDALLVDTFTGEVVDVIRNFFW